MAAAERQMRGGHTRRSPEIVLVKMQLLLLFRETKTKTFFSAAERKTMKKLCGGVYMYWPHHRARPVTVNKIHPTSYVSYTFEYSTPLDEDGNISNHMLRNTKTSYAVCIRENMAVVDTIYVFRMYVH